MCTIILLQKVFFLIKKKTTICFEKWKAKQTDDSNNPKNTFNKEQPSPTSKILNKQTRVPKWSKSTKYQNVTFGLVLFEKVIFVLSISYTNGLNSYTNSHNFLGSYYIELYLFWIGLNWKTWKYIIYMHLIEMIIYSTNLNSVTSPRFTACDFRKWLLFKKEISPRLWKLTCLYIKPRILQGYWIIFNKMNYYKSLMTSE